MRLINNEVSIIKNTILEYISDATIILFGSRVYDNKKGGDIDLLVQTSEDITLKNKLKILTMIELRGITRKVDLVFDMPATKGLSIVKTALAEGIKL